MTPLICETILFLRYLVTHVKIISTFCYFLNSIHVHFFFSNFLNWCYEFFYRKYTYSPNIKNHVKTIIWNNIQFEFSLAFFYANSVTITNTLLPYSIHKHFCYIFLFIVALLLDSPRSSAKAKEDYVKTKDSSYATMLV